MKKIGLSWASVSSVTHKHLDHLGGFITSGFRSSLFYNQGWGDVAFFESVLSSIMPTLREKRLGIPHHPLLSTSTSFAQAGGSSQWHCVGMQLHAANSQGASMVLKESVFPSHPKIPDIQWTAWKRPVSALPLGNSVRQGFFREGTFESPAYEALKKFCREDLLPQESRMARFLIASPSENLDPSVPFVVLLAGTGEHTYSRRLRAIAQPLLSQGIGSIILENAFYGRRKPLGQIGAKLFRVSDLLSLGYATIEEARALLAWLYSHGYRRLCVSGASQGGLHAAMAASLFPYPVAVVASLAPDSASFVFTKGILSNNVNWNALSADPSGVCSLPVADAGSTQAERSVHTCRSLCSPQQAALCQLQGTLELTNIENFPLPVNPRLAVLISGDSDAYIDRLSPDRWKQHWPWMHIRQIRAGHVSGILFRAHETRKSIVDMMNALSYGPMTGG